MGHGPTLLVAFLLAMSFMFVLLRRFKVQAFLALLAAAFLAGLAAGLDLVQVSQIVAKGFGGTAERIGIMIVAGAIIGVALERSGATYVIVEIVIKAAGERRAALALSIVGFIVAVPVFCDAGFIVLAALNKALAKRTGNPLATMTAALATSLYATNILVPPTSAPVAAAKILGADIGTMLAGGLLVAVPAAAAGYFWATRCRCRVESVASAAVSYEKITALYPKLPGLPASLAPVVLPLLLIALKTTANCPGYFLGKGSFKQFIDFAGEPMVALLLGVVSCLLLVSKLNTERLADWVDQGIKAAAPIVLVTGAGGALGSIFLAVGFGNYLGMVLLPQHFGIFLPFIMAAILKTIQGTSLAALITTSTIIFPILATLGLASSWGAVLVTLASGAGAMMVSHVNDPYFWIVTEFSGLSAAETAKTYTTATFIMGVTTMVIVWFLAICTL